MALARFVLASAMLASLAMAGRAEAQARWFDLDNDKAWAGEQEGSELSGWRAGFDAVFSLGVLHQEYESSKEKDVNYDAGGLGVGVTTRLSLQYLSLPRDGECQNWLGAYFAGGIGGSAFVGIRNRVEWQDRRESGMGEPGTFGVLTVPLAVGFTSGVGSSEEEGSWHGFAWGLGYAPALTVVPYGGSTNAIEFSWAGFEVTIDPGMKVVAGEATRSSRIRAHVVLPAADNGPLMVSVGYGWVWW